MAKLTIEELRKGREEARGKIHLRDRDFRGKVIVHLGTCGIAAGAREIVSAFLNQKESRKMTDLLITTSGCAGLCSKEPMATVELADAPPVKYGNLTSDKAIRIFEEHILGGKIVQEYAIGLGSERGG
jgi:NADP-reducing hydrogenase subunit HndB